MPFKDRQDAGKQLALQLLQYRDQEVLVLALPRGGIPVGFEIAQALQAPLDVLVIRKLGAPYQEELAIGALGPNHVVVLNVPLIQQLGITETQINHVIERESRELSRRLEAFRGDRPFPDLTRKTVILVDDGLATGATAAAAIVALKRMHPRKIILAASVCSPEAVRMLSPQVDSLVCLLTPRAFEAVGSWYQDFRQTTDMEVCRLLKEVESAQQPSRAKG